jgi:hypothetical protein
MKTRKINLAFILFFSASFMLPCLAEEKADSLLVEINVNSGLPNPVFVITDAAVIAHVRNLMQRGTDSLENAAALVDSNTVKSYFPKLGYRGLRITDIGPNGRKKYIIREQMMIQVVRPEKSMEGKSKNPLPRAFKDNLGIEKTLVRTGLENRLIEASIIDQLPARLK